MTSFSSIMRFQRPYCWSGVSSFIDFSALLTAEKAALGRR
jgi:hypothetical protein